MKICIIESPFAARTHKGKTYSIEENKLYLQKCLRHAIYDGFAPFASHQMYTDCLDDDIPAERELGMSLVTPFLQHADHVRVYCDRGISSGMEYGIAAARSLGLRVYEFKLWRDDK